MGSKVLSDVDEAFFDNHFHTNVKAPLFTVKHAIPHMTARTSIFFFAMQLRLSKL